LAILVLFPNLNVLAAISRGMWDEKVCMRPIMPPYSQSRPDGRLKSTASAFNRLWISMPAVLVAAPTDMQNSLHHLLTSSISARHLLHFVVVEDNRGRRTDNPSGRHPIRTINSPTSIISPLIYVECPFCRNSPNLSLGQAPSNANNGKYRDSHTHNRLTAFCPGLPG